MDYNGEFEIKFNLSDMPTLIEKAHVKYSELGEEAKTVYDRLGISNVRHELGIHKKVYGQVLDSDTKKLIMPFLNNRMELIKNTASNTGMLFPQPLNMALISRHIDKDGEKADYRKKPNEVTIYVGEYFIQSAYFYVNDENKRPQIMERLNSKPLFYSSYGFEPSEHKLGNYVGFIGRRDFALGSLEHLLRLGFFTTLHDRKELFPLEDDQISLLCNSFSYLMAKDKCLSDGFSLREFRTRERMFKEAEKSLGNKVKYSFKRTIEEIQRIGVNESIKRSLDNPEAFLNSIHDYVDA